jgi:hypothetical protein
MNSRGFPPLPGRHKLPLQCAYCYREGVIEPPVALATIHDRRGCLHVCAKHAAWRLTTSFMLGHSQDCPLRG